MKVKEKIKSICKRWFIDAFSGMAQGLFCTLIIGTIIGQIADWVGDNYVGNLLRTISLVAKLLMGVGIGVGIANALNSNKLVTFTAGVTGLLGAFADKIIKGELVTVLGKTSLIALAPGNPIGAYVVALLTIEIASLYAGKTKVDIILVPLGMCLLSILGVYVANPFILLINKLSLFISWATGVTPFFMGIIISVVMGILLTMPTSSAAIWIAVASQNTSDAMLIAGGAAVVGCCCHMVGFAVASFRENGISGLISQGIGTSMLQIPNVMKKPIIMLPEIIASALLGPIATCVFKLKCNAVGGGMGTSGLVGIVGTINASSQMNVFILILAISLLMIILPASISFITSEIMRKEGWIELGDQKL